MTEILETPPSIPPRLAEICDFHQVNDGLYIRAFIGGDGSLFVAYAERIRLQEGYQMKIHLVASDGDILMEFNSPSLVNASWRLGTAIERDLPLKLQGALDGYSATADTLDRSGFQRKH